MPTATVEPETKKPTAPQPLSTKLTEAEVLAKLGRPVDLHSIHVNRFNSSTCRVNVWRKMSKAATEAHFQSEGIKAEDYRKTLEDMDHSISKTVTLITDSFHLRTNYDGSLRSDNPAIERKY